MAKVATNLDTCSYNIWFISKDSRESFDELLHFQDINQKGGNKENLVRSID